MHLDRIDILIIVIAVIALAGLYIKQVINRKSEDMDKLKNQREPAVWHQKDEKKK